MKAPAKVLILGLALVAAAERAEPIRGAPSTALGKDVMKIMDSFLSGASHSTLMDRVHKKSTESGGRALNNPLSFYVMPFLEWALEHNVSFDSLDDVIHGLENFAHSDDMIAEHDSEKAGYTLGHNAYSHMSWEEFKTHFSIGGRGALMGAPDNVRHQGKSPALSVSERKLRTQDLPEEVDWVAKGAVTNVKNQGACGSCWSFSTTGAVEGALFLNTGNLVSLSEQELVDCDTYDMGCNGGLMDYSFHWIQQNGGICSEADYPYVANAGMCNMAHCETVPGTDVDSWVDVGHSEQDLMAAVAQQPVSIAIEADQMSFQLYSGGVLTATCGTQLDHGVLLVGYGASEDGVDYWKVKNSWGADWGMDGYILLERGSFQQGGECGILMQPSYPVLV